jgi:TDG/mug DNA glycosylase family protein
MRKAIACGISVPSWLGWITPDGERHFPDENSMNTLRKPTKAEIQAAIGKMVPDIIAPNLRVLFCGINPSLYSAVVGRHFARPGNRFWKTLHAAGFTDRLLSPAEDESLLEQGYGVTNIVDRATATADELAAEELIAGHQALAAKVQHYQPQYLAILGISAYRTAFKQPKAVVGRQDELLKGAILWVLPNPSGLNAHYQLEDLRRVYRDLLVAVKP